MPTLIEGVVSDFAQPGDKSDRCELTLGDMEEFAEKLKNMRLTYDHEHPAQSDKKRKINQELTVGKIVDAYIDEDECLRVRAELDDDTGNDTKTDIESGFLSGFSLGIKHAMSTDKNGVSKFKKELVELSITPQPEFAATSFVRVVDSGTEENPIHCKLSELSEITAERRGQVVAITASSGERDEKTARRARELLIKLKRAKRLTAISASSLGKSDVSQVSNGRNLNSQQTAGQTSNSQQRMSNQFAIPQATGSNAQLDAHIAAQLARREAADAAAIAAGHTFTQQPPRSGIAPVHIHNYMDGRRPGYAQTQQRRAPPPQRQQPAPQQRRQRQQQQQIDDDYIDEPYGDDNIVDAPQYEYDNEFVDDDGGYDDMVPAEAPRQPAGRRGQPYARPQQQQQQQPQRRRQQQQQQPRRQKAVNYEDAPPPTPDVAQENDVEMDPEANRGATKSMSEIRNVELKRLKEYMMAGGKLTKKQLAAVKAGNLDSDNTSNDVIDDEQAEFEAFKKFQQLKQGSKRKQQEPEKKRRAAPASDNMVLDDNEESDHGDANDDDTDVLESSEAKTRREMAASRAKTSAKNANMKSRINNVKKNLAKPSLVDDNIVDTDAGFDDDGNAAAAQGDGEEGDLFEGVDLGALNSALEIDEHGGSQAKDKFDTRVDEIKNKRKKILALSQKLVTAKSENKDKLAATLFNQKKALESEFQKEKNQLIDDALAFTSTVNTASGKPTDMRTVNLYQDLKRKKGLITDQMLDMVGTLVSVSASSGETTNKTLASVNDRFKREQAEREAMAFRMKEAERLAGRSMDSAAAARMVANNDPVTRSAKNSGAAKPGSAPFFVPRPGREAVMARDGYAGYDPVTMLPAGKSAGDFTQRDITGLPIEFRDEKKAPEPGVIRQKKPNAIMSQLPRGLTPVTPKKGIWRTGDEEMISAISASRASTDIFITPDTFTRVTRHAPEGAELAPGGKFWVMPDPSSKGQN
jgi:hypothetical protein